MVNVGDMATVLSNGMYKSTVHKVVNNASEYRVSVPFFYGQRLLGASLLTFH